MTLGLKLLKSLWQKQSNSVTSLEFIQVVNLAKQKSLSEGQVLTLLLNKEKNVMELSNFIADDERLSSESKLKTDESDDKNNAKKTIFRSNLPPEIEDLYSASGIKLSNPVIFIHFYPDGTSDSFIVKFKNHEKPYFFIPRNGGSGVYLSEINNLSYEN